MKKFAVMRFKYPGDVHEFLRKHQELSLYDTEYKEFLVAETEKSNKPKYKKKTVARFVSENDRLIITSFDSYIKLSDNAKKIVSCVKMPDEEPIKLQIGKSFNGITVDEDLYYEVFHFATDNGLKYWRHDVEDGEQIEICINPDSIVRLE